MIFHLISLQLKQFHYLFLNLMHILMLSYVILWPLTLFIYLIATFHLQTVMPVHYFLLLILLFLYHLIIIEIRKPNIHLICLPFEKLNFYHFSILSLVYINKKHHFLSHLKFYQYHFSSLFILFNSI